MSIEEGQGEDCPGLGDLRLYGRLIPRTRQATVPTSRQTVDQTGPDTPSGWARHRLSFTGQ